jgi:hypothetical protein
MDVAEGNKSGKVPFCEAVNTAGFNMVEFDE